MRRRSVAVSALAAILAVSGCTSQHSAGSGADPSDASTSSANVTGTPSAEPVEALHWHRLPGSVNATVMSNGTDLLSVAPSGASYSLAGKAHTVPAGSRVSDALLDDRWAVVAVQDKQMRQPERATVTDLRTGSSWTLDGSADLPTTTGGSWTLAGDTAVHATLHQGRFCVASVDLATRASTLGWCAPPRHGWNAPIIAGGGLTILTFDDHHPSCRTLDTTVQGDPFARAAPCKATSGAVLPGGAVWLEVRNEQRYEVSEVRATTADGVRDLGPADTGSLLVCGGAAYWAMDAQKKDGRAELRRWDGTSMTTVYRSKSGQAFMGEPVCAGSVLTVSSFSTSGDELVAAHVA